MSDGAYAIYVPLGSLAAGETKEATIFYAAAGASKLARLAHLSEEVDEGMEMRFLVGLEAFIEAIWVNFYGFLRDKDGHFVAFQGVLTSNLHGLGAFYPA